MGISRIVGKQEQDKKGRKEKSMEITQ